MYLLDSICSATQCSQKLACLWPHHKQSECELGACSGTCAAVSYQLCPNHWGPYWRICKCQYVACNNNSSWHIHGLLDNCIVCWFNYRRAFLATETMSSCRTFSQTHLIGSTWWLFTQMVLEESLLEMDTLVITYTCICTQTHTH